MTTTRAFAQLQYDALRNYIDNYPIKTTVEFNWEKRVPIGRYKLDHYRKAGRLLSEIIQNNITPYEPAVLIIPSSFMPIVTLADNFNHIVLSETNGFMEIGNLAIVAETGTTFTSVAVVLDPELEDEFLLFDKASGNAIKIVQGKYDYDADLADLEKTKE